MTNPRHYSEDEISKIFEQAVEAQEAARKSLPNKEGLTLDELQKIGADLGITPDFVAQAAASLDKPRQSRVDTEKKLIGLPVRVERIVELPRSLTDDEWSRLVVDLRETFNAKGKIEQSGSLRQWTNGNLQVMIEPSPSGYRLRMRSMKQSGRDGIVTGGGFLIAGLILFLLLFTDAFDMSADKSILSILLMIAGSAAIGYNAFRLPQWHSLRAQQMEAIGERTTAMLQDFEHTSAIRSKPRIDLDDDDVYGGKQDPYRTRTGGRESY